MMKLASPHRVVGILTSVLILCAAAGAPPAAACELLAATSSVPRIAQLWTDPGDIAARDLLLGPGGTKLIPSATVSYRFKEMDTSGHSRGYEVKDPGGRKWKVKVGDEAQSEIVASRLLWALGYHQPVMHYIARWRMTGGPTNTPEPGRFRLESDHEKIGTWDWKDNPFVGTRQLRGLIVADVLLNNWDLGEDNNRVYAVDEGRPQPSRWFVVQDVGAALGKTRWPLGTRNVLADFESQEFIKQVKNGRVVFDYHGPHDELLKDITPEDVVWTCRQLDRLTDKQLRDAFRAAHYDDAVSDRYMRKIKAKIQEGLGLGTQVEAAR